MKRRWSWKLPAALGVLCAAAIVVAAPESAPARRGFGLGSLEGRFAAVGLGDSHVSSSVGTTVYDGNGNVSRSIVVNAPGTGNTRRLLTFDSIGTYEIHTDGTGVIFYTNHLGDGSTTQTTFDIVVQETAGLGRRGVPRATQIYGVQREHGTTVALVTLSETLIVE
jgi:hypothetical protein